MGDHVQPPVEELHAVQELQEDHHAPPHVIKCGGEDGENGGAMSQRQRLTTDASNSSLVRRGRGEDLGLAQLHNIQDLLVWMLVVKMTLAFDHVIIM